MKVYMMCGKGGVGKTNSAVSLALHLSKMGEKSAIVDYDGGHSVASTLGINQDLEPNRVHYVCHGLKMAVVENTPFIGIAKSHELGWTLIRYLTQFRGSLGILPLADMVNAFFGVPTDVAVLQKFSILVDLIQRFEADGCSNLVVDVEPTAGLERFLSNIQSTTRSLRNLKNQGVVSLAVLGTKWPDIKGYLKWDYIRNADEHAEELLHVSKLIKTAVYMIVSTPEPIPVSQAFDVRRIIRRFGGSVHGFVVNNTKGERHETRTMARFKREELPHVVIPRRVELVSGEDDRLPILLQIGDEIVSGLKLTA